ncbi:MAG TPA: MFS transporter, partial [Alphaproteobacteria bacterium]|nr:MFS transporter [Alphaproteobacteria bacterium]
LLRINRLIEIFIFGIGSYALAVGHVPLLLLSLLLTGTAAAFYSPVKYAITPELVHQNQLLSANGAIETGVYSAILFGTLLGTSVIVSGDAGVIITIAVMLTIAISAWGISLCVPNVPSAAPELKIDFHIFRQIWKLMRWGHQDKLRLQLLLGHAWFWFVGAAVLSQLTIFVKEDLHSVPELNTLLLALFALGIGIGSFLCNRLLRSQVSLRYASVSALGMAVCCLLLAILAYANPPNENILSLSEFLSQTWGWLMLLTVTALSASAGLYVVPILSLLQLSAPQDQRAQLLSLANIWFAIFVILSSVLSAAMIAIGGGAKDVFAAIGVLTLGVAVLARICYKQQIIGAES